MAGCVLSMASVIVPLVMTEDGWRPGIGDPTLAGFLTVFAYFAAAYACQLARTHVGAEEPQGGRLRFAFLVLSVAMVVFGVNKQLDLQSWLTEVGRKLAVEGGWYDERRRVQLWFIRTIAGLAAASLLGLALYLRRHLRVLWLACLGGVFIAAFVVVRAASFHHVDLALGRDVLGLRLNWILELSGIACVGWSAFRYVRRRRTRTPGRLPRADRSVEAEPPVR